MKIIRNNNKGHGAPEIPTILIVIFLFFIFSIPFAIFTTIIDILHWFGYLLAYNSVKYAVLLDILLFLSLFIYVYFSK
ncbi:MAG TPA: hypothetical protein PKI46_00045 [Bacteroidales bacterium]|nr:hypothetical protein [Bacteroidales bacterium]